MGDPIAEHHPIGEPIHNGRIRSRGTLGACVAVRFGNTEEIGYEANRTQNYVQVWLLGTSDVVCHSFPKQRVRVFHPMMRDVPVEER